MHRLYFQASAEIFDQHDVAFEGVNASIDDSPSIGGDTLDSLLNLITDLVADGLLLFRLLFCSRTALRAEVLFLRKQLAFYEKGQVQPRRS
jgi:hypothetical protein